MKCLLCPAEIDENKPIHPLNVYDREQHAKALEGWEQVTITLTRSCAVTLFSGHVCPAEKLNPGDVTIARSPK